MDLDINERSSHKSAGENESREQSGSSPSLNPCADLLYPGHKRSARRKKPTAPCPPRISSEEVQRFQMCSDLESVSKDQQNFWKYHLVKFGLCMYLTTNPTIRHLHCRNAPGYFIRVSGSNINYRLSFEDIETGSQIVVVEKISSRQSYHLNFSVKLKRCVKDGKLQNISSSTSSPKEQNTIHHTDKSGYHSAKKQVDPAQKKSNFSGVLHRHRIPRRFLPSPPISTMVNYQSQMPDGQYWSVGSIPRTRESRLNPRESRYVSKSDLYFHQCFQNTELDNYTEHLAPPALAVFRECTSSPKKRIIRRISRLSRSEVHENKLRPSEVDISPYENINYYYKGGDGLYRDRNPIDDEPDYHHKLGWITLFDDNECLASPGMFDLAVALTVAISYEKKVGSDTHQLQ